MTNNIVFDASCGISEEEQREIFAQINRITEKNRLSLAVSAASAEAKGKKTKPFKAKKSGGFFPMAVNAAAIAVLAGGFIALYAFQGKTDAEVREGAKVYNSAERTLIGEILTETSGSARQELNQLSREQSQAATVEAQMAALFANLSRAINENNLDEASRIIRSMRDFLNTPAFAGLRSIQARKELYAQTINSFDTMIEELRRTQAALASGIMSLDRSAEATFAQLQERAALLDRDLAERERTLQASNSARDSAAQDVAALQRRVEAMQTQNETLTANLNRESQRVNSLQETVTVFDTTIRSQTATISNRDNCIQQIRQVIQGKVLADMSYNELNDSLSRIQAALQTLN